MQKSQTKLLLAQAIFDTHQEFSLNINKVVSTTTDNGSNYVAAFESYGNTESAQVPITDEQREEQQFDESETVESDVLSVEDTLRLEFEESLEIELPPHHRCRYCL